MPFWQSRWICVVFRAIVLSSALCCATFCLAQTSKTEAHDQIIDGRTTNQTTLYPYHAPSDASSSFLKNLADNVHGSYSVTLMGPRWIGASNTTYNIYLPDLAPIQLYHSTSLRFEVSPDFLIGFGVDAIQNVSDGVVGLTGIVRGQSFEMYDPTLNFAFPHLIQLNDWSVYTTASFSLAVTQNSINIGRVTSINLNQSWTFNNYPSDWTYGFNINVNPQFYVYPIPAGFSDRKTFYASVGHFLSYRVSSAVQLQNSTTLDLEHHEPMQSGFFDLGAGLPDRMKFAIAVTPNVFPMFLSFGAYTQMLLWEPSWDTTITGLEFTVGF